MRFASLVVALLLLLSGCASTDRRALPALAFAATVADRSSFRAEIEGSCEPLPAVDQTIARAVAVGAPIFNAGSPIGCFLVYEGAAYKILDGLGTECRELRHFLRAGLAKAQLDEDASAKAWTLRITFDTILGERTRFGSEDVEDFAF